MSDLLGNIVGNERIFSSAFRTGRIIRLESHTDKPLILPELRTDAENLLRAQTKELKGKVFKGTGWNILLFQGNRLLVSVILFLQRRGSEKIGLSIRIPLIRGMMGGVLGRRHTGGIGKDAPFLWKEKEN